MEFFDHSRHVPTPKPLRILKQSKRDSKAVLATRGPPITIPRRRSSYAIRGASSINSSTLSKTDKENYKPPPRNNQEHLLSPTSIHLNRMGKLSEKTNALEDPATSKERSTARNGFFSRVTQAFDFRSRQLSTQMHGYRVPTPKACPSATPTPLKDDSLDENHTSTPSSISGWKHDRQHTPPLPLQRLSIPRNRTKCKSRSPQKATLTTATIDVTADALKTEAGDELSTWLSAEVFARVDNLESNLENQSSTDVPLDVMIVVDNSSSISPELLHGACQNAFHVASSLDILIDRVAIGCMSTHPEKYLNLMLPLESHSPDVIRNVFRSLPAFQLLYDDPNREQLSVALREAGAFLLRHSGRSALCHLFCVTARSMISIPDGWGERLRFHTISPENSVILNTPLIVGGWHLSAGLDNDGTETAVKSSLRLVIKHLRMGIDPGVLSNLSINLSVPNNYEIIALLGDMKRKTLRPGESWAVLVKVRECVPGEKSGSCTTSTDSLLLENSMNTEQLDDMIDQLHGMFKPSLQVSESCPRIIASVEYSNSSLSSSTLLKTEGKCDFSWRNTLKKEASTGNKENVASHQMQTQEVKTGANFRAKYRPSSWRLGVSLIDLENHEDELLL
ncbi:hypothetical protein LOZ12_000512 [Ophidiomyces ophidiicola]|uniref:Uncharacterized protein n=1 Tax=Ophidiomyces ophidiicola TaxID=1387563 RepID=A0ACB8V552_9EURO|nr:uncharacterized protein LOZ57_003408 [Ophidiomyces ophidiicola]KAI1926061.1 hypothetical protein LOZ64_000378 [Ophidiomyces ophidiicola]KAI1947170.1 hypothetical protein LOZ57_003408 [Ophidiomyces ophidiicola]KAI1955686.1 hypothetical protein LOZ62_000237 [Ophidiomyces ophidiicola]KAI1975982.1 hypothetical protein LOZ56_000299 [Ophidiomyces ophidiicola]KAI2011371.1 hypothetical protein LOZ50_000731 [Ophidiomyces ophidiicola]